MSKAKQREIKKTALKSVRVDILLKDMKLKDLQRECIMRGMDFEQMVKSSVLNLSSWLINNWELKKDRELLNEFDHWNNRILYGGGNGDLVHDMLNLGYFEDDTGKIKQKRVKGIRKEHKKKERTEDGIFKGTKKALTYECAKKGLSKKDTIDKVMAQFPEASEKSIGIWYNKAKKSI